MIPPITKEQQLIDQNGKPTLAFLQILQEMVKATTGRILRVPVHASVVDGIPLTNQNNTESFLGLSARSVTLCDLAGFTQYRLVARIMTGSASANNPRLYVRYKAGAFSTTVSDFLEIGTSAEVVSMATVGHAATPWTPLVSGAIANDVFIAVMRHGGDGVADPEIGNISVEFK